MRILMFVNKDSEYDPRVRKEADSLIMHGHSVYILSASRTPGIMPMLQLIKKTMSLWWSWLKMCRKSHFDIVHAHDLDTLPIAFLIAKLNHKPIIYDAHDLYWSMVRDKAPASVCSMLKTLEGMLSKHVDHIIVATDDLKSNIVPEGVGCTTILNCSRPADRHTPRPRKSYLRLAYIGSLEPNRSIIEAIEAVERNHKWRIIIIGKGSLESEVIRRQSERVMYLGGASPEVAQRLLAIVDAQLICCNPDIGIHKIGIPTRLFDAMAYGKPSIATYHTKAGDVVKETNSGILCGYGVAPLSIILEYLSNHPEVLTDLGKNAQKAFRDTYNWPREESKLIQAYEGLRRPEGVH